MRHAAALMGLVMAGGAIAGCGLDGLGNVDVVTPPSQLPPGMVFATRAIPGAADYDLFWVSVDGQQGPIQITSSGGNDWMPAASDEGHGIAFAREGDGIFFIAPDGSVTRLSDTRGTRFADAFPAISRDGDFVAWVRSDRDRPVSGGWFESYIMMATVDAGSVRILNRQAGLLQLAPAFSPAPGSTELIWTEVQMNAQGVPEFFNLRRFDHESRQGELVCPSDQQFIAGGIEVYCWGFHLAWPDDILLAQQQVRLPLQRGVPTDQKVAISTTLNDATVIPFLLDPDRRPFFQPWPLSASVSRNIDPTTGVMVFDGFATFTDGREPSLVFFRSTDLGQDAQRIQIPFLTRDRDFENTADYLFSVATPSLWAP